MSNRFGEQIFQLRIRRRLLQKQIAATCGIDASYLAAIEKGRRNPPPERVLESLLKALDANQKERNKVRESAALDRLVPLIDAASKDIRHQKHECSENRRIAAIQKKRAVLETADTISNVARSIGCQNNTASKLFRNPNWAPYIRTQAKLDAHASLRACIEQILADSISLGELTRVSGIPKLWRGHFARASPHCVKLVTEFFSYWRIPKGLAEKVIGHFSACKMNASPANSCHQGFIRIADVGNDGLQLQKWIQDELFSESLPLVYEQSTLPSLLVDFSIPLNAIKERFRPRRKHHLALALKLIRYPEALSITPGQLDAVPA